MCFIAVVMIGMSVVLLWILNLVRVANLLIDGK